jgi:DNA polymerase alpha subunit A
MKTRGGSARAGDVISYVFCIKEGEDSSKSAQADRAKHPDEVRKATDGLKIGELDVISDEELRV